MSIPVAFYAPLKSPEHPSPSGDRTMGRLLMRALAGAGFAPNLASELRSFEPGGEPDRQRAIRTAGLTEAERLLALYRSGTTPSPRLWFTYHCYYKAPDWIGPAVARGLGIPYAVAEGSRAGKRADGPWAVGHAGATAALDAASVVFAITDMDADALLRDRMPGQAVVCLPPFLDIVDWPVPPAGTGLREPGPLRLLAVAMMRPGDKLGSYRALADALGRLPADLADAWHLTVAGDGPARSDVEEAFAPFGVRVGLSGRQADRETLARLYERADLLVWPAVNEAYGMALLEAQAMGCPVLAGREGGVASAMREGVTGLLVEPRRPDAFASALAGLIRDPGRLRPMREAARRFVRDERDLPHAAAILRSALDPLVAGQAAA